MEKLIVISAPSGAGKTSLVSLLSKLDNFEISISHTTRKPRSNETPNKDYYFINEEEFNRLIQLLIPYILKKLEVLFFINF